MAVDPATRHARRAALIRIGIAAALLVTTFVVARLAGLSPSAERIEQWGDGLGPLGLLVFVPVGVGLNCLFVPLPVLAGAAGLLFGTVEGTAVGIVVVAASATVQMLIGRRLAGERTEALLGRRGRTVVDFISRRGFWTVLYVRLVPGIPFNSLNYAVGLSRLRAREMFAGTGLGFAPRTFAYAALGGSVGNLGSTEARVALGIGVVLAVVGAVLARRQILAERSGRGSAG
jgi:uncharacterized membrane protein YdjX (TVP38/TMEM64 family)